MPSCLLLWRPRPPRAPCSACCSRAGRLPQCRQQLSGSFACCSRNTEMLLFLRLDFLCVEWKPELSVPTISQETHGRRDMNAFAEQELASSTRRGESLGVAPTGQEGPAAAPGILRFLPRGSAAATAAGVQKGPHAWGSFRESRALPRSTEGPQPFFLRSLPLHLCLSFPDRLLWPAWGARRGPAGDERLCHLCPERIVRHADLPAGALRGEADAHRTGSLSLFPLLLSTLLPSSPAASAFQTNTKRDKE